MKDNIEYNFHHFGIPVEEGFEQGIYSERAGMYTVDNQGKFRVQWHQFTDNSDLSPVLDTTVS
ncbi:hypothetical protein UXO11_22330 [Enterobacter wuhouensis]|uniref:hypothetical protein n=1 Tax=Enterobacter wuhouensis TaxID=2529381 RepID=UPI002FD5AA9F